MTVTRFPGRIARPQWWNLCVLNERGRPVPNYANACIPLEHDPALIDSIAYDDMLRMPVLLRSIHGIVLDDHPSDYPRPITDKDVGDIQRWMQDAGITSVSYDTVHRAVFNRAQDKRFHPVIEWLDGLTWDGEQRLDIWLAKYLGVTSSPYAAQTGQCFLMQMVARIYQPGCQADYMLILEGNQGILKTNALKTLAYPWYSDDLPDISTSPKDAAVHLRGKWLVEIAELHAFNKAEATHLKSFVTRCDERFRPPYGRAEVIEPRQCCFVGTTNKDLYLKDETGGRRFWPHKCGDIRIDELAQDREQLFAEAIVAYRAGVQYWPERKFEAEFITPEQVLRYDGDVWEDLIRNYLDGKLEITLKQIATGCLDYGEPGSTEDRKTSLNRFGTSDQNRIKRCLQSLGWYRSGFNRGGNVVFRPKRIPR
jgi:predicted P-loop ATPase